MTGELTKITEEAMKARKQGDLKLALQHIDMGFTLMAKNNDINRENIEFLLEAAYVNFDAGNLEKCLDVVQNLPLIIASGEMMDIRFDALLFEMTMHMHAYRLDQVVLIQSKLKDILKKTDAISVPARIRFYAVLSAFLNMIDEDGEAFEYIDKAIGLSIPEAGDLVLARANLIIDKAGLLQKTGKISEAEEHVYAALEIIMERGVPEPELEAAVYSRLAETAQARKDTKKALEMYNREEKTLLECFSPPANRLANICCCRTKILLDLKEPGKALTEMKKARDILKEYKVQDDMQLHFTYNLSGDVEKAMGNYQQAYEYKKKAQDLLVKRFGELSPELEKEKDELAEKIFHKTELQFDSNKSPGKQERDNS